MCHKLRSGRGSIPLLVMASANALIRFAFPSARAGGMRCSGSLKHNDARASCINKKGRNNQRDKRGRNVSCRIECVPLDATGCCVVALNILLCSWFLDWMTNGGVRKALGYCPLKSLKKHLFYVSPDLRMRVIFKKCQVSITVTVKGKCWCGGALHKASLMEWAVFWYGLSVTFSYVRRSLG